ncbi:hypothetical protein LXL04_014992 [Taraxacum kok-saghyz]
MENFFDALPEGFVAEALALTSPRDACRLSSVNSVFRSAAQWDSVWESFTPPEYLLETAEVGSVGSKKEVYLRLCDHPVIMDEGNKCFWLEKRSGKKCYMLAARQLSIAFSDSPNCWIWTPTTDSRFTEVAELVSVSLLEIVGKINTSILSPNTTYVALLVFKRTPKAYGFEYQPVEVCISPHGDSYETRMMYLDPEAGRRRGLRSRRGIGMFGKGAFANWDIVPAPSKENGPKQREDGWLEIEIGEYFNGGDATELELSVTEGKGGNWKTDMENFFEALPEGFVAEALALTSPRDACRLSSVNSVFHSAAQWDSVWESFTPPEYLPETADGGEVASKKEMYLRLCDHPVIIDAGNKSFWLDKRSGKKCYMLAARQLSIAASDSPHCWIWTPTTESRFTEVAELISVSLLEIVGKITTSILSPNTTYVALLVFKTTPKAYGFEFQPVEVCISSHGYRSETRMVYLDPEVGRRRGLRSRRGIGMFGKGAFANWDLVPGPSKENGPKQREDGWLEIEIGEYFNGGDEPELELSVAEVKGGNWKTGLIIQGIEFRPQGLWSEF